MKLITKTLAAGVLLSAFCFSTPAPDKKAPVTLPATSKIQVAILLDVSGSMEGLIEQAKAQLWNMVTTLGKAECTDKSKPQVELALYEYGRSGNDAAKGYVKQLSPFTNDLDKVSQILFNLKTDGGSEYCGQVIYTSMEELAWNPAPENYKVVFIAGNEDFLQGNLHYTKACSKAADRGVIVNTIYCGDYQTGIREHWNLLGECGKGSYTNINHNARDEDIPTPYDSTLIVLNNKLNTTYIGYGATGAAYMERQFKVDAYNYQVSTKAGIKRAEAKARSNVYNNASWDLIDASKADTTGKLFTKLDKNTLPDSLKTKTPEQLKQLVDQKAKERGEIQQSILSMNASRDKFIAERKARNAQTANQATLETAVEKTIREQVQRFKMKID
ncbi:MAG: VWA domain-containing protein [Bacteroidetes bacterium]|nr:VWA domain-containing protein [Bacteroidota bacterium]